MKSKKSLVPVELKLPLIRATHQYIRDLLRLPAPKPRILPLYGTGGLHDEQQHCFELGWKEGIASYRRDLKDRLSEIEERYTVADQGGR